MNNKFFIGIICILLVSCKSKSGADTDPTLPSITPTNIAAPVPIMFSVTGVYPHDATAFTQGLEFYKGKLYEGTGDWGKSRLRITDIKTGVAEKDHRLTDTTLFGEGITIFKNKIYQLTWKNNKIFVYNLDDITKPIRTLSWSREGWGMTNDGNQIIISDGTSKLYFVQPDENANSMKINKIITVQNNLGEVDSLNELELIGGFVYANRWLTDDIVKIDTSNGHVVGVLNLKGLLSQYAPGSNITDGAVLNGIAYDSATRKVYITGKDWPKLFELKFND